MTQDPRDAGPMNVSSQDDHQQLGDDHQEGHGERVGHGAKVLRIAGSYMLRGMSRQQGIWSESKAVP